MIYGKKKKNTKYNYSLWKWMNVSFINVQSKLFYAIELKRFSLALLCPCETGFVHAHAICQILENLGPLLIGLCVTFKRQSKFQTKRWEIFLKWSGSFQAFFNSLWPSSRTFLWPSAQPQPQTSSLPPWINDAFSTYTFPLVLSLTQTQSIFLMDLGPSPKSPCLYNFRLCDSQVR